MNLRAEALRYLKTFFGAIIISLAIRFFLVPNNMVLGGVSGLAVIVYYLTGLPPGALLFLINLPLFLISLRFLGKAFLIRAFFGVSITSVMVEVFAGLNFVATTDPFLVSLYSGLIIGVGAGIILSAGSSAGGFDLIARIVRKKRPDLSLGQVIMIIDFSIIALGALVIRRLDNAMYAFFSVFIVVQMIDFILSFGRHAKVCYIITEQAQEIAPRIMQAMSRGLTILPAHGGYSGQEKNMLVCAIKQNKQTAKLKQTVLEIDPTAFIIIHNADEVLGGGWGGLE